MSMNTESPKTKRNGKIWVILLSVLVILLSFAWLVFFFWIRPRLARPLDDPLNLEETDSVQPTQDLTEKQDDAPPPVCGDQNELVFLVVGTDYRQGNYLYGLADAIRVVRIDFTVPQVNVVALPRALLIEQVGNQLDVNVPILLNQAYLFGTAGMGHYAGSGYGAGALAETIQVNFGLTMDHYLVLDFAAFTHFVDLIGGIEIDLPETVHLNEAGDMFFPAGLNYLDGKETLQLARARTYASDNVRIDRQTLILKAIFQRLRQPEMILKLPQMIETLTNAVLTDFSLQQIPVAICLLDKLESEQIRFYNPDTELIQDDREFIPTMSKEMNIFRWDRELVDWIHESLWPLDNP